MNSRKRISVGQNDFTKIIKDGYYFVDKTLLIKEIIEKHDFVNLITRPRRFGKTINVSMMRAFFEQSSENRMPLFENLKIAEEKELIELHMGKYPVISLTFMDAKHDTWDGALGAMQEVIAGEFRRHYDAVNAYEFSRERIAAILNAEDKPIAKYDTAIKFLSEILSQYYHRPVIILIDEYDVPLEASYSGGFYPQMLNFMRSLLRSALKSNTTLHFAVLTGCLRLAKESVFTGLNNFTVFSLTDPKFSAYFGFDSEEVREMLDYFDLTDKQDEMKEWFDGYNICGTEIYNPWSVIKQVNEYLDGMGTPRSHWANTSSNEIIKSLIEKADSSSKGEIEELMAGKAVRKRIIEELTYNEIYNNDENIWTFLLSTGYLTTEEVHISEGSQYAELRIPNKEIRYIFEHQIIQWFEQSTMSKRSDIWQALLNRDKESLQQILTTILFHSISYMDYSENYYHGIMTGLFIGTDFALKSNRETGLGRADIVLQTIDTAIIIELKTVDSKQKLNHACQEALIQINEKCYADEFVQEHIIILAIAFHKKSCEVLFGELDESRMTDIK